jgi:hypothetical protein
MSSPRRSQRARRATTFYDDRILDSSHSRIKKTRRRPKLVDRPELLEPVVVEGPSPNKSLMEDPLPEYQPELQVVNVPWRPIWSITTPILLFLAFLGSSSLDLIARNTNMKAQAEIARLSAKTPRHWSPTDAFEVGRFFGTLFYMGRHREYDITYYWKDGMHRNIQECISILRWQQLNRFLTINANSTADNTQDPDHWWSKLDPLAGIIRNNCQKAVSPSTWIAIDEVMIAFKGRSSHTVKQKNKPIKEGFKVWAQAFDGYIYNWLYHSAVVGPEDTVKQLIIPVLPQYSEYSATQPSECSATEPRPPSTSKGRKGLQNDVILAPTKQVVWSLYSAIRSRIEHPILAFIDNLFTNVPLAKALRSIQVFLMGTTRQNAEGFPASIKQLIDSGTVLQWGGLLGVVVNDVLCFYWQDSGAVLGMTTAFDPSLTVTRSRRRPKRTSTNARNVWQVFDGQSRKDLPIPAMIDAYNYHMNGVDRANHLRANFSCHRPNSRR